MKKHRMLFIIVVAVVVLGATMVNAKQKMIEGNICGIVIDVRFFPAQSALASPNLTVVYFNDGRLVLFKQILRGMHFQIGKRHTIRYIDKEGEYKWSIIGTSISD